MDILNDPSMKEIVDEFFEETLVLLDEMEGCLDELDDDLTQTEHFEGYGQRVDRVMGAAKGLGLAEMGSLCELGKIVGYKASQIKDEALLNIVLGVLYDEIDILRTMVKGLQSEDKKSGEMKNSEAFAKRMRWLSDKFAHIDRGSVSVDKNKKDSDEVLGQQSIDDLLNNLGL